MTIETEMNNETNLVAQFRIRDNDKRAFFKQSNFIIFSNQWPANLQMGV